MPQAVAAWLISATGATGLGAAAIQAGVGLAFSIGLSKLTQPKGPSAQESQLEIKQSDAPRIRYLGLNRVSGAVMYWDVHNTALWKLWAVAQGGHNGVVQWYADDEKVTLVDNVVADKFGGKVSLWERDGQTAGGGLYSALQAVTPYWTPDHRLDGVGTFLMRAWRSNQEKVMDHYPGGEPSITAVIRGDSARRPSGVPQHTQNLAWHLYDILTHPDYGPLTAADMDAASWAEGIARCADQVPTAGGTRYRFLGGGGYRLDEPVKDVAERWLAGMAGSTYLTTSGKLGLRVGVWTAPKYTITEDKIVSMEYSGLADDMDGVGSITPKYVSPELEYQETTADPWEDAAALARWGETAAKELPLQVVQNHAQARHLAKIELAKRTPKWRFTLTLRFWGLLLLEEDKVFLHLPRLGIVNQPAWIESYAFNPDGDPLCTVTLISADPASFDVVAAHDGTPPAVPVDTSTPVKLADPVITSVEVETQDGDPYIIVTANIQDGASIIGQYRKTGTSDPWQNSVFIGSGGSFRTLPLRDGGEYDVRVAAGPSAFSVSSDLRSNWVMVEGIEVISNEIPPDAPVLVSRTGTVGGSYSVTFEPDLGVNYELTRLYRGGPADPLSAAVVVATTKSTAQQITLTSTIPAGGSRFWLRSENESGVKSTATAAGQYT